MTFTFMKRREDALEALKTLQSEMLDEHKLEVKMSERLSKPAAPAKVESMLTDDGLFSLHMAHS